MNEMLEQLKIDPEFEKVIPPLTKDEYHQLEENILDDGRIIQRSDHICRKIFTAGKVNRYDWPVIVGIGKKKHLKVGRIGIAVYAAFGQRRGTVCFNVDAHNR